MHFYEGLVVRTSVLVTHGKGFSFSQQKSQETYKTFMGISEYVQKSAHEGEKKMTLLNPVPSKVKSCVAPKYKEINS